MSRRRKDLGDLGERLARQFLEKKGFIVKETNFRCSYGEIDIIAQKGDSLVFVEVRTRQGSGWGTPEESITPEKKEHLVAVAEEYLQSRYQDPPPWRIDVVAVELEPNGRLSRVELIENALS